MNIKKAISVYWSFFIDVIAIAGFFLACHEYIKSDKEKFNSEETIMTYLKPKKITQNIALQGADGFSDYIYEGFPNSYDTSKFYMGDVKGVYIQHYAQRGVFRVFAKPLSAVLYKDSTDKNIDLMSRFLASCTTNPLFMTVKDERVYVKTDVRDINTGQLIGRLLYNKCILYKDNISSWHSTDSCLEVKDKQGYIVLSLRYVPSGIVLNGYFMDATKILVLNNSSCSDQEVCFDMREDGWRFKAGTLIQSIPSVQEDTFTNAPF